MRSVKFIAFFLSASLSPAVFAQWQSGIGAGMRYADSREFATDGKQTVKESGWLPGIKLEVSYRANNDWRTRVSADVYRNDLVYDGSLQNGTPFKSTTGTTQARINFEFARRLNEENSLIAALEYDYWRRDIHGSGGIAGLDERYRTWRLLAGIENRQLSVAGNPLAVTGAVIYSTPERMTVRFGNQTFDDASLSTRSAFGLRLHAQFLPKSLPNVMVNGEFNWIRVRRSGDTALYSNGMLVGTLTEPEHSRQEMTFNVIYRF